MDSTCSQVSQPTGRRPKKNSAKRDGEKRGVGSFGAQGLHHARHPVESRKNGEGLTCPGLSSTKPGWAQLHITAQSVPPVGEKQYLPARAWRRGVVTMVVVVVVVVAPKWNEQRKNEPGVRGTREKGGDNGTRETSTDGFHLPDRRGRREDQRKTVVAAVDPCSVSKPHGKNEREGDTGARGHSNHGLHLPDKRQHKRRKRARPNSCRQ